jgi:hypothetical protein
MSTCKYINALYEWLSIQPYSNYPEQRMTVAQGGVIDTVVQSLWIQSPVTTNWSTLHRTSRNLRKQIAWYEQQDLDLVLC